MRNGSLAAKLTPGTLNVSGFHTGGDVAGNTGTLDMTVLPNGTNELALTIQGGGEMASTTNRFILDSTLKIGQFSFSQQDLAIPVNGMPLTVTQTYNSLNPDNGDFGFSWTYAVNGIDVRWTSSGQGC